MKKIYSAMVLLSLLVMAGCAGNQTQAQREFANTKKIMDETIAASNTCGLEISNSDNSKLVLKDILFATPTSPNRMELMASNIKLTESQKAALKIYIADADRCRQIYISGLNRVSMNMSAAQRTYYAKIDAIYLAMLKGDFTIGDANVARNKAMNERNTDFDNAWAADKQRLETMDNNEYAQRQQAAAIMMPYLMQQQAIQSQQQQNLYNQQMQQIQRNTPVYTPPINTTCTAVGNQLNCTSR